MTDCCTPGSNFPNASLMQQLATNHPLIWKEISLIQQKILEASSLCSPNGGQMCITVAGDTPMTFVSGITNINVLDGGSGYVVDTPSIKFISPEGSPSGAGAIANVITNGGNIMQIQMVSAGAGYQPIPATLSVTSTTGVGAILKPNVNANGQIISVNILNGGNGYEYEDTIVAARAVDENPYYINAVLKITEINESTGAILGISVLVPGTGYQDNITTVEIVSSLDENIPYPFGVGFTGTVLTNVSGGITGVQIQNTGSGYIDYVPYLQIIDSGNGAITKVNLDGNSVDSIDILAVGNNYTINATGEVYNPSTVGSPNLPTNKADVQIEVNENIYETNPNLYWQVWVGAITSKPIEVQINNVISYFTGLGYTIVPQSNPSTGSTLQWKICW